jgi:hypothetical protein
MAIGFGIEVLDSVATLLELRNNLEQRMKIVIRRSRLLSENASARGEKEACAEPA